MCVKSKETNNLKMCFHHTHKKKILTYFKGEKIMLE